MKCLKNAKTGNIIRVDDKQAYQMAGREWQYVSKTEWKGQNKSVPKEATNQTETESTTKKKKKVKQAEK